MRTLVRRVLVLFECKVVAVGSSASDIACFLCAVATAATRTTSAGATAFRQVVSGRNGSAGSSKRRGKAQGISRS